MFIKTMPTVHGRFASILQLEPHCPDVVRRLPQDATEGTSVGSIPSEQRLGEPVSLAPDATSHDFDCSTSIVRYCRREQTIMIKTWQTKLKLNPQAE